MQYQEQPMLQTNQPTHSLISYPKRLLKFITNQIVKVKILFTYWNALVAKNNILESQNGHFILE